MSDQWRGPGWWYASDGKWYPPAVTSDDLDAPEALSNGFSHVDRNDTPDAPADLSRSSHDVVSVATAESADADVASIDPPHVINLADFDTIELVDEPTDSESRTYAMATAGSTAAAAGGRPRAASSSALDSPGSPGSSVVTEVAASTSEGSPSTEAPKLSRLENGSESPVGEGPSRDEEPPNNNEQAQADQTSAPRSSVVFAAALLLAVLSGVLASLWLRERSVSQDLRADLAAATEQQSEIDLTDLEDALNTARLQNQQLEQQVADMSALVLELPAGRLSEITVPFDPAFADESNGRLVALSAEGDFVIWSNGADNPITDSGTLPDVPTGLFAGSARAWVPTEAGVVEILSMRPEIAPEAAIQYGPLMHVVPDERGYWSFNTELSQVVRLERAGGAVTDMVSLPVAVVDMTIGAGSVWALGEDGLVYRVNTADLTLQSFDLGPDLISITAGPDALWTLSAADGSLRRVDPVTGSVLVTVPVGRDPIDAMFAGSSVWVGLRSGSSIIEVDTATSAVVSRTELISEPTQLFEGDSGVYVSTVGEGSPLLRIDSLASSGAISEELAEPAEGAADG